VSAAGLPVVDAGAAQLKFRDPARSGLRPGGHILVTGTIGDLGVRPDVADRVLAALRAHPLGSEHLPPRKARNFSFFFPLSRRSGGDGRGGPG
jgi:hypothetical protein